MDVVAFALIFAAVIGLQMLLLGRYCFHKLNYRCEFSVSEAHEGDSIYLVETVYNAKILPVPWLKVDIHSSRWLDFAGTCSVITQDNRRVTSSFTIKSYQKTTRRWTLNCLKRGVFTTENVTLVSGDLLNLRVVSVPVAVNAQLMVYPEIVDIDEMFAPVSLLQSDITVNRWIVDDPFIVSGAREYMPGDSMSRIHWPATAAAGNIMVKNNDFTSERSLTVLLNMQSKLYEYSDTINKEIVETGIKVAATLFDRSLKEGMPVSLGTNGCITSGERHAIFTKAASDKEHIQELLRILAKLLMKNVRDFEAMLDDIIPALNNTDAVIITAYLSRRICEQADIIAGKGNSVRILLLDTEYEDDVRPFAAEVFLLKDEIRL